jgi:hypothetical protein
LHEGALKGAPWVPFTPPRALHCVLLTVWRNAGTSDALIGEALAGASYSGAT